MQALYLSQKAPKYIDHIGFHYTQAAKLPCNLNEDIAKLQFRHLEETGTWLSDKEAKTLWQHQAPHSNL